MARVSEIIRQLQQILEHNGDLEVWHSDSDLGDSDQVDISLVVPQGNADYPYGAHGEDVVQFL